MVFRLHIKQCLSNKNSSSNKCSGLKYTNGKEDYEIKSRIFLYPFQHSLKLEAIPLHSLCIFQKMFDAYTRISVDALFTHKQGHTVLYFSSVWFAIRKS